MPPIQSKLPKLKQLLLSSDADTLSPELRGQSASSMMRNEFDFIQNNLLHLETLSIRYRSRYRDLAWATFLTHNVKLKCLGIHSSTCEFIVRHNSSRHIMSTLVIYQYASKYARFSPETLFTPLGNLKKLTKLGITFAPSQFNISFKNLFNSIIRELQNVRTLMLAGCGLRMLRCEICDDTIMKLGRELLRLEHFYIHYDLDETDVIKFVECARNLNTFWWVRRKREITKGFVKSLADIRKEHFGIGPDGIIVLNFIYSDSFYARSSKRNARKTVSIFNTNIFSMRNKLYLSLTLSSLNKGSLWRRHKQVCEGRGAWAE